MGGPATIQPCAIPQRPDDLIQNILPDLTLRPVSSATVGWATAECTLLIISRLRAQETATVFSLPPRPAEMAAANQIIMGRETTLLSSSAVASLGIPGKTKR
ncbi:hypothetical protein BaRGS_00027669 [Batillaria attramentaria]|uniref:Uncharacterized protein n=1 Tax=Batillaria attramentaria TaxID=370345 RepID=A0ABD0K1L1_9CAEN